MALITAVPPMVFASCVRRREEKNEEVCQGKMKKVTIKVKKKKRVLVPFLYLFDLQSLSQSFHKPNCQIIDYYDEREGKQR
jgi:hypothetical protein